MPWVPRWYSFLATFLIVAVCSSGAIVSVDGGRASANVQRDGARLVLYNQTFRFSGANIYWLGLDENVPPGTIAVPTPFRVDDALTTAVGMGARAVRSHTLGVSCGFAYSFEPTLGEFHADALRMADYAVARAEALGLKLVIPLTDNYHYFHGGKHCFTDWIGVPEEDFYTNAAVIDAFEAYIRALLTHVNPYTGRPYHDTNAILAWETGNELLPTPGSNWTARIAAFIKSVDAQHLVLSGTYGVSLEELPYPEIDIHSMHFYPPNTVTLQAGMALCAAFNKTYLAGEIGWTYNASDTVPSLESFLSSAVEGTASGTLYWSLFPHADDEGFVPHNDGFTLHYPGDWPFMANRTVLLATHATQMKGEGPWTPSTPATRPQLHRPQHCATTPEHRNDTRCSLSWRGSALARSYSVYGLSAKRGNLPFLVAANVTDDELPVNVSFAAQTDAGNCFVVVPSGGDDDDLPGPQSEEQCH